MLLRMNVREWVEFYVRRLAAHAPDANNYEQGNSLDSTLRAYFADDLEGKGLVDLHSCSVGKSGFYGKRD